MNSVPPAELQRALETQFWIISCCCHRVSFHFDSALELQILYLILATLESSPHIADAAVELLRWGTGFRMNEGEWMMCESLTAR